MKQPDPVVNIIIAGLGGQGVLKASDIVAEAAFHAGYDVKKAEVHGMSQRGGSVACDVRYGKQVFSPMVPRGEADFLVVLASDQVENNRAQLRPGGTLIEPSVVPETVLRNKKSANVFLLGVLSRKLAIPEAAWTEGIRAVLPQKLLDVNLEAFAAGRSL
jgi:indolepyruvate ferredoxin oxidoreductase beta subunit